MHDRYHVGLLRKLPPAGGPSIPSSHIFRAHRLAPLDFEAGPGAGQGLRKSCSGSSAALRMRASCLKRAFTSGTATAPGSTWTGSASLTGAYPGCQLSVSCCQAFAPAARVLSPAVGTIPKLSPLPPGPCLCCSLPILLYSCVTYGFCFVLPAHTPTRGVCSSRPPTFSHGP